MRLVDVESVRPKCLKERILIREIGASRDDNDAVVSRSKHSLRSLEDLVDRLRRLGENVRVTKFRIVERLAIQQLIIIELYLIFLIQKQHR